MTGKIRRIFTTWAPTIIWLIMLINLYAILTYVIEVHFMVNLGASAEQIYMRGFTLLIPLILLVWGVKTIKQLWQFLFFGIILVIGMYLLTSCYIIGFFTFVLWFFRTNQRLQQGTSAFDEIYGLYVLLPIICFVISGINGYEFYQKLSLYNIIIVFYIAFAYFGIKRFEQYIELRKEKANIPIDRILNMGTKLFLLVGMVLMIILVPVIENYYDFMPFSWELETYEYEEEYVEEEVIEQEMTQESGLLDFTEAGEPNLLLQYLWALIERITAITVCILVVYFIYVAIRKMVVDFRKVEVEHNDVIESTFLDVDERSAVKRKTVFYY